MGETLQKLVRVGRLTRGCCNSMILIEGGKRKFYVGHKILHEFNGGAAKEGCMVKIFEWQVTKKAKQSHSASTVPELAASSDITNYTQKCLFSFFYGLSIMFLCRKTLCQTYSTTCSAGSCSLLFVSVIAS